MEVCCIIIIVLLYMFKDSITFLCQIKIFKLKLTRKTIHEKIYNHKILKSRMSNKWFTDPRKVNPKVAVSKSEKQFNLLHLLSKTYKLGDHLHVQVYINITKNRKIGWKSTWEAIRLQDFLFHDAKLSFSPPTEH